LGHIKEGTEGRLSKKSNDPGFPMKLATSPAVLCRMGKVWLNWSGLLLGLDMSLTFKNWHLFWYGILYLHYHSLHF
jgi:hypothetical protein